jgi:hypothetical protein
VGKEFHDPTTELQIIIVIPESKHLPFLALSVQFGIFCFVPFNVGLVYPILGWHRCPEIGTSSIDWAKLSGVYLKTETESSLRNLVF